MLLKLLIYQPIYTRIISYKYLNRFTHTHFNIHTQYSWISIITSSDKVGPVLRSKIPNHKIRPWTSICIVKGNSSNRWQASRCMPVEHLRGIIKCRLRWDKHVLKDNRGSLNNMDKFNRDTNSRHQLMLQDKILFSLLSHRLLFLLYLLILLLLLIHHSVQLL